MESPTLFVVKREKPTGWDMSDRLSTVSTSRLLKTASNPSLHLFLREPAFLELAHRGDSRILNLCEKMITSSDPDEMFVAIQVLSTYGTQESIERLLSYCVSCDPSFRIAALHALATALTPEYTDYFTKLVTPLACTGVLDITAWTPSAITALERACQRKSIRVVSMSHSRPMYQSSSSTRIPRPQSIRSKTESQELKKHLEAI